MATQSRKPATPIGPALKAMRAILAELDAGPQKPKVTPAQRGYGAGLQALDGPAGRNFH